MFSFLLSYVDKQFDMFMWIFLTLLSQGMLAKREAGKGLEASGNGKMTNENKS